VTDEAYAVSAFTYSIFSVDAMCKIMDQFCVFSLVGLQGWERYIFVCPTTSREDDIKKLTPPAYVMAVNRETSMERVRIILRRLCRHRTHDDLRVSHV